MTMANPAQEQMPSQPWLRIYNDLYSKGVGAIGEQAFRNYGRYKNSRIDKLIELIPVTENINELKKLYSEINEIFMKEIPVIPLLYRPGSFYQVNNTYWTNWPTESNPYAAPASECLDGAGIRAFYEIKSTKK